jgi:hypothetical protein
MNCHIQIALKRAFDRVERGDLFSAILDPLSVRRCFDWL